MPLKDQNLTELLNSELKIYFNISNFETLKNHCLSLEPDDKIIHKVWVKLNKICVKDTLEEKKIVAKSFFTKQIKMDEEQSIKDKDRQEEINQHGLVISPAEEEELKNINLSKIERELRSKSFLDQSYDINFLPEEYKNAFNQLKFTEAEKLLQQLINETTNIFPISFLDQLRLECNLKEFKLTDKEKLALIQIIDFMASYHKNSIDEKKMLFSLEDTIKLLNETSQELENYQFNYDSIMRNISCLQKSNHQLNYDIGQHILKAKQFTRRHTFFFYCSLAISSSLVLMIIMQYELIKNAIIMTIPITTYIFAALVAAALAGSVTIGLYYSRRSGQEDLNIKNKRMSIQSNNSDINSNKDILATVEGKMLQCQVDINRINRLINNQNQSYLTTKKQSNILLLEAKNIVPSTVWISKKNIGIFSSVTIDEKTLDQSRKNYCNIS